MSNIYAVLGSGMQGTAAAYDLALFGEPSRILMADSFLHQSRKSVEKVNNLLGKDICIPVQVDVLEPESLRNFLEEVDVVLSCVPYWMHPLVAVAAIHSKTNMVDLGGNTDISLQTLSYHEEALAAGVTVIPDTGLAPGLVVSLASASIEYFDQTEAIKIYCGGLPQHPKPPFNYKLVFNIEGLLTEYMGKATVLREGEILQIDTLSELEILHIDLLGEMEAFVTSGGTSTAPYSWKDCLLNFEYKTMRYPGHCVLMKIFKDYGFWGTEPIETHSGEIKPIDLFMKLMGETLKDPYDTDLVVVQCLANGIKKGVREQLQIDIMHRYAQETNFSAMEQLTGFSTSICAIEIAKGHVKKGCVRYEKAMSGEHFVEELQKRGIQVKQQISKLI